jgi:DNA-binding CsgD family transcriptional regulator
MDASAGAQQRRRTATEPDRRSGQRRRTDVHESAHVKIAREAALATLDKFNRGVFLLDDDGAVCFANRAAEAMVARRDGLLLRRGRLQFKAVDANAAFEAFLANGRDLSDSGGLVLRADGSRLKQPYRVLVSRLSHRYRRDGGGAGYCVFIYEPNGGHQPVPVTVLHQLYGLTPAEARLANALFGGRSLAESADSCNISVNTAKSVLKRIFTKCAVHSQPELLLLLSLGPRTL